MISMVLLLVKHGGFSTERPSCNVLLLNDIFGLKVTFSASTNSCKLEIELKQLKFCQQSFEILNKECTTSVVVHYSTEKTHT